VWINICRATVTKVCGSGVSVCQQWNPNDPDAKASLGSYASQTFKDLDPQFIGLQVLYSGGDSGRQTQINFICDSGEEVGYPRFVMENPDRHYIFQWVTKYACPM
jgi:hypothetical protein